MAEGVGFEPTEVLPSTVFKTAAFDHSAIPPRPQRCFLPPENLMVNLFVRFILPACVFHVFPIGTRNSEVDSENYLCILTAFLV